MDADEGHRPTFSTKSHGTAFAGYLTDTAGWSAVETRGDTMRRSAKRFISHIKTDRGMSPATVSSYEDDLKKFISFAETRVGRGLLPGDVTPGLIQEFLEFLGNTGYRKKNVASSRAKRLVSIRSFFSYLHREGLLGHNPAEAVKVPKVVNAEPHYLQEEDCHALVQGARRHPNEFVVQRDQALLATFLATGARVSELIRVDLGDLDLKGKRVRLHRKGGDVQSLPLSEHVLGYLRPYMTGRRRRAHCRAVFVSVRGHRLTQQSVRAIVDRCARQARLPRSGLSPHTLRHTFATMLLANGENLETIRVLMNHKSLATTARYLHTQDEQLNAAVNRITLSGS